MQRFSEKAVAGSEDYLAGLTADGHEVKAFLQPDSLVVAAGREGGH